MKPRSENGSDIQLSVSHVRKQIRRPFTETEIGTLRRVADALIPATGTHLAGSEVRDFVALVTRAATILDKKFEMLTALLKEISAVADDQLQEVLRSMEQARNSEFYILSLIIVAAYLYSEEMKKELRYPMPHQNPASMFEIADELSTGILDPVIERGPIFVDAQ